MIRGTLVAVFAFACTAVPATQPQIENAGPPPQYASLPSYEKGSNMTAPKVIKRVEPQFPHSLMQGGSSVVTIETIIDEAGKVLDGWYVSGDRKMLEAALVAVRQWKFQPALMDGKPVPVRFQLTISINSTRGR